MANHAGGYNPKRSRPTAYVDSSESPISKKFGRTIILSSGRGDTKITPAEARELAAELLAEAEKAERLAAHPQPQWQGK